MEDQVLEYGEYLIRKRISLIEFYFELFIEIIFRLSNGNNNCIEK